MIQWEAIVADADNLDRVWVWYLLTVSASVVVAGGGGVDGDGAGFVAIHLGLFAIVVLIGRWARGMSAVAQRTVRSVFTVVGLPVVFSSLGMVLPAIHPEPFEWTWIAWDRALLGDDPTRMAQALVVPWFVEILQVCYASFYLLPVLTLLAVARVAGGACFDRGLLLVTFCFLASYAGYILWPTLPPYRFLPHEVELQGLWLSDALQQMIDRAEINRWDCFPSGHTMLSLVCVGLAWRWARRLLWGLVPVVGLLVLSTLVLRYHYLMDVLAGAVAAPVGVWWIERVVRPAHDPARQISAGEAPAGHG